MHISHSPVLTVGHPAVSRTRLLSLVLTCWLCNHLPLIQGGCPCTAVHRRAKQEPVHLHDQGLERVVPDPGVLTGGHGVHCLDDTTEQDSAEEAGKPGGPYLNCEWLFLSSG